jgi:hypothetical protein
MSEEHKREKQPVVSPATNKRREAGRALAEAAAGVIPYVGSFLTRLYRTTHPLKSEQDRKEWQVTISTRTNENTDRIQEHDELLAPKVRLGGLAVELATALAVEPGDGMRGKARKPDELYRLLPCAEPKAIDEAAFELGSYGLLEVKRALGNHWWIHLTQQFYEQIDYQVMGWNTAEDARFLGSLILDNEARSWIPALHAASRWDKRRFNPALSFLLHLIPDERVSQERQSDYPTRSMFLLPEDRATLRRFVGDPMG